MGSGRPVTPRRVAILIFESATVAMRKLHAYVGWEKGEREEHKRGIEQRRLDLFVHTAHRRTNWLLCLQTIPDFLKARHVFCPFISDNLVHRPSNRPLDIWLAGRSSRLKELPAHQEDAQEYTPCLLLDVDLQT
eukprot:768637-Hanusia_phi.AAC.2